MRFKAWLRENYGWQTKKRELATLAFALLLVLTLAAALALSGNQ